MSSIVISTDGLGKQYRVGERERYLALRDVLMKALRSPLKWFQPARSELMWALKDVSLQVKHGEVVGLIGHNGAGKTTLLKILARVTRPTVGSAEVRGRIGSLLEVGTGFHPELSGRENMFLSGAILGMGKREIVRKFDEIVAFAGVERFIDTPLKHYSTGMQMRLAFAVAAHLEPDVLLVDEVLAVGDVPFQRKCMGKMEEVSRTGRTIIFVSHNIGAINALCSRAVLMRQGTVCEDGPTADVTSLYYAEILDNVPKGPNLEAHPRAGSGKAKFSAITIEPRSPEGDLLSAPYTGCDLTIKLEIESQVAIPESNVAIIIYDSTRYRLVDVNLAQKGLFLVLDAGQKATVEFNLRNLLLKPGTYFVSLWLGRAMIEEIDSVQNAASLEFVQSSETTKHVTVFPGPYLCRFETTISSDPGQA